MSWPPGKGRVPVVTAQVWDKTPEETGKYLYFAYPPTTPINAASPHVYRCLVGMAFRIYVKCRPLLQLSIKSQTCIATYIVLNIRKMHLRESEVLSQNDKGRSTPTCLFAVTERLKYFTLVYVRYRLREGIELYNNDGPHLVRASSPFSNTLPRKPNREFEFAAAFFAVPLNRLSFAATLFPPICCTSAQISAGPVPRRYTSHLHS